MSPDVDKTAKVPSPNSIIVTSKVPPPKSTKLPTPPLICVFPIATVYSEEVLKSQL